MALPTYTYNLFSGLSDFWQQFFADSDHLKALYDGAAVLMGQAYLDMLSNVLNVSLSDCTIFNKELYKLVLIREDQIKFERGVSVVDDRWVTNFNTDLVYLKTLDNKIIEPTASLQEDLDFDIVPGQIRFKDDPTNADNAGNPLPTYARRQVDIRTGGKFDDSTRGTDSWYTRGIRKGDILRLLNVNAGAQFKRSDYTINLVRQDGIYIDPITPIVKNEAAAKYVILRRPAVYEIQLEDLLFDVDGIAQLSRARIDAGSVKVYGKAPGGEDVREGIDYLVDYENGLIQKVNSWLPTSSNKIDYSWKQEVWPLSGPIPRYAATGVLTKDVNTRVTQMAFWAPDVLVDRRTLANNFGSLIGSDEPSSESYRAFLRGIFQLYTMGPVIERIESALNVVLGLPLIRDDGEVLISFDMSNLRFNRITTLRPTGVTATYDFPKTIPIRTDIVNSDNWNYLTFSAFENLTNAITVTDYVEDPSWWHNIVIPSEVFSTTNGSPIPDLQRRTVNADFVKHVIGPNDRACVGDPGLIIGADENGDPTLTGDSVYRRRFSFIMMDRYLKRHMFAVQFDPSIFAESEIGVKFARNVEDLNQLVFDSKPAHTYIFVQPSTVFNDLSVISDDNYYQPQRYAGANPDLPEFHADISTINVHHPYYRLGVELSPTFALANQFRLTDNAVAVGSGWAVGDYFRYQERDIPLSFPAPNVAVPLPAISDTTYTPTLLRVIINGSKAGAALVENVDYTVNVTAETITRLTSWDANTALSIHIVEALYRNITDASPQEDLGDTYIAVATQDPKAIRAVYPSTLKNAFDVNWSTTDPRDISMVDRPLTIKIT